MAEVCLFCNGTEKNYQPDCEFVCSGCVQLLLDADQDDLQRAYNKATNRKYVNEDHRMACEKEYLQKAKAISMFLIERETDVRKAKKLERNLGRKRSVRNPRPSHNRKREKSTVI